MKTSRAEVSSALVNFTSLPPLHKLRRQRASYAPSLFAKRASASAQAEIRAPLSNRPTSSSIGMVFDGVRVQHSGPREQPQFHDSVKPHAPRSRINLAVWPPQE